MGHHMKTKVQWIEKREERKRNEARFPKQWAIYGVNTEERKWAKLISLKKEHMREGEREVSQDQHSHRSNNLIIDDN